MSTTPTADRSDGYVTDGIFQTYDEVRASAQYDFGKNYWEQTTKPGDFRFRDLNGDGRITAEDRTYLGSPLPKFVFCIPLSAGYKDFDLSIFMQGQTGNKIFNVMDNVLYNAANGNVYSDLRSQHWSGQLIEGREYFPLNTSASVPDLRGSDQNQNFRASDFFVHDGSYLRMSYTQISYTPREKYLKWIGLNKVSFYFSANNPFVLTKYSGVDPDISQGGYAPAQDHAQTPRSRSYTLGITVEF